MLKNILTTCFFALVLTCPAKAEEWKWTGFEIIGSHRVSRDKLIAELPIKIGDVYKEDLPQWHQWCDQLKVKFDFYYTDCSSVRFLDFRAYLVVSIVEKGQEYRVKYRDMPTAEVVIQDPQIFGWYDQLMTRLWQLFDQGISAGENTHGDYLEFEDEVMHGLVAKLIERSPASKDNLIEIIKSDKDSQKRAKAAWLLNWALTPLDSIEKVYRYLDDPVMLVRNDISRFMSHWTGTIEDEKLQRKVVDALILQLKRPSHADRNKALSNLLEFITDVPSMAPYLKAAGGDEIDNIAATSVLENVGGLAKNIQKHLKHARICIGSIERCDPLVNVSPDFGLLRQSRIRAVTKSLSILLWLVRET